MECVKNKVGISEKKKLYKLHGSFKNMLDMFGKNLIQLISKTILEMEH